MIHVLFAFIGTVLFIQIWKQCTNIEISLKIQPIFVFSKERSKVFYTFCRFIFTAWLDETEAKKWSSSCCYTLIFTCFMSVVQPVLHMSFCGTCLRQNSGVWPFFFSHFHSMSYQFMIYFVTMQNTVSTRFEIIQFTECLSYISIITAVV